jgi:acyl-[acyl-carrier-protein] desaturase
MQFLEKTLTMLISFNTSWKNWQPADFLPNSESDTFDEVKELREIAKDLHMISG